MSTPVGPPGRTSGAELGRMAAVLALIVTLVGGLTWWFQLRGDQPSDVATVALADAHAPRVGEPVGSFTATTAEGQPISLADYAGRPLWLTFGASWCTGCRTEAPDMQAAHEAARGNGTAVVFVYLQEEAAAVRAYADRVGLTTTNVPDPDSTIATAYQAVGVPMHYFVGRDGVIRSIHVGVLSRQDMDRELAAIA